MKRTVTSLAVVVLLASLLVLTPGLADSGDEEFDQSFTFSLAFLQPVVGSPATGTWSATGGIVDAGDMVEIFVADGELTILTWSLVSAQGSFRIGGVITFVSNPTPTSALFEGDWEIEFGTGAYLGVEGEGSMTSTLEFLGFPTITVTHVLDGEVEFDDNDEDD